MQRPPFVSFVDQSPAANEAHVNLDRMLDCISAVESGNTPWARGRANERSAYQITPATWATETSLAFSESSNPLIAREVARKHLVSLIFALREQGFQVTPFVLALAWNCGIEGIICRKWLDPVIRDRAERCANLYFGR